MLLPKFISLHFTLVGLVLLCSCNSSGSRKKKDDGLPERSGQELGLEALKFYDANAVINSTGSKIGFISGRDDALRAYQYDVSTKQLSRISSEDDLSVTEESLALSNALDWAAIVTAGVDGKTIQLVSLTDTTKTSMISNDDGSLDSDPQFSQDGTILAFVRLDPGTKKKRLVLAKIGTDGVDGSLLTLEPSDESYEEYEPQWIDSTPGTTYDLYYKVSSTASSTTTIAKRQITVSGSTLSASTASSQFSANLTGRSNQFSQSENSSLYVVLNQSLDSPRSSYEPEGSVETDDEISPTQAILKRVNGDSTATSLDIPGLSYLSIDQNDAGNLGIAVARDAFSCSEDSLEYGFTMILYDPSLASGYERIVTLSANDDDKSLFERGEDVCDRKRADDADAQMDKTILSARIAKDSTNTSYKFVYVSYFTGDSEVILADKASGTLTLTNVSQNITE